MQESKVDKQLCSFSSTDEILAAIENEKLMTGKFKEELFHAAITQLLRPYSYQIGIGHSAFIFRAAPKKAKQSSFWVKRILWLKMKQVAKDNRITMKAVIHTAFYNYFVLPKC